MSQSNFVHLFFACSLLLALTIQGCYGNGSCQQYGHSCLGGHGKRDGSDVDVQNALLKNPAAARYNNLLREIMARRSLGPQAFIPNSDWSRYQDSQELLEKKSIDYSAV